MDININGSKDGINLAKQLNEFKEVPIIYMTAFGDTQTINEASETNLYGFVIKPFTQNDIEAVLNVAITRVQIEAKKQETPKDTSILDLGYEYIYDFTRESLYFQKNTVTLSKNESKLISLLCSNYGHVLSSETLRVHVWGEKNVTDSTIRDTILRIRKKTPLLKLENVPGRGYSLNKS